MTVLQREANVLSKAEVLRLIVQALDDFIHNKKWGTVNVRVEVYNGDIKELGLSQEQTYRAVAQQRRN